MYVASLFIQYLIMEYLGCLKHVFHLKILQ